MGGGKTSLQVIHGENLDPGAGKGHEGRQEWLTFGDSELDSSSWTESNFLGIILTFRINLGEALRKHGGVGRK